MSSVYATPKCPECGVQLRVGDFIGVTTADCHNCGRIVSVNPSSGDSKRSTEHSPSPQRETRTF